MIDDTELTASFNYWWEHYKSCGDRHYEDTSDWKITELYYDLIVDRVLQDYGEEETDYIVERLSQLF